VWVESLFVAPEHRRRGVAAALYRRAEELSCGFGGSPPYNYVHPNNDAMIGFLKKRGYTVLNLIELRRPRREEPLRERVMVGEHAFDY